VSLSLSLSALRRLIETLARRNVHDRRNSIRKSAIENDPIADRFQFLRDSRNVAIRSMRQDNFGRSRSTARASAAESHVTCDVARLTIISEERPNPASLNKVIRCHVDIASAELEARVTPLIKRASERFFLGSCRRSLSRIVAFSCWTLVRKLSAVYPLPVISLTWICERLLLVAGE